MAKQQEPVIRQTPEGPMREIREKFPTAWYAAGIFCLVYACAFPLYRLHHFLICAGLACAAAFLAQRLTPERIRLEPYQAPLTGDALVDELLAQGQDALRRLRSANDALTDEAVSASLDTIEAACTRIFTFIRENPQQAGQIRKFMNYYLPTLLQLLDTLTGLEAAGASGQNIDASKRRITGVLHQAADAFDNFYDRLHAEGSMNVNAEIRVFEDMLRQEGLLEDPNTLKPQARP